MLAPGGVYRNAMFETYMGGTRPSESGPFASRRRIISAASTGCRTPGWDGAQRCYRVAGCPFLLHAWALGPGPIHIHPKQTCHSPDAPKRSSGAIHARGIALDGPALIEVAADPGVGQRRLLVAGVGSGAGLVWEWEWPAANGHKGVPQPMYLENGHGLYRRLRRRPAIAEHSYRLQYVTLC
jgi:hypothetical protein